MNRIAVFAAMSAIAAAAAGCATSAGTSVRLDHAGASSVVYEGNTRLANRVDVVSVTYDKTPSGMNRVNVGIVSRTQKTLDLQYRISWYNADGMEIDGVSRAYRTLVLQGMDSVSLTGVANSPDAVVSKIRIREAKAAGM